MFSLYTFLLFSIMDFLSKLNSNKQEILNMLYTYFIS